MSDTPALYTTAPLEREDHRADAERLQRALLTHTGRDLTVQEAETLWSNYSQGYSAGWLIMPAEDAELVQCALRLFSPHLSADAPAPAPLARLYARFPALQLAQDLERRKEIKAYVDGVGRRNAQETRTFLSDLLAQITRHQQAHTEDARLLTARAEDAEAQVAGLKVELGEQALGTDKMSAAYEGAVAALKSRAAKAKAQVAMLKAELAEQEADRKRNWELKSVHCMSCHRTSWDYQVEGGCNICKP